MGMQKTKVYTLTCDGPCKKVIKDVSKPPTGWEYLKFLKPSTLPGEKPITKQATLCPDCLKLAQAALASTGVALEAPL